MSFIEKKILKEIQFYVTTKYTCGYIDGQDAQSPESQGSQPQDSEPQEHELKPPKGNKKDKMPAEQAKLIKKATASLDLLAKITEDWHDAGTKLPKERSQPTITAPA